MLPLLFLLLAAAPPSVDRVAFGSCADEDSPQPIWQAVHKAEPDLFVFLGDNVYADTRDPDELRRAYTGLAAVPGYAALRASVPIVATWDDHDYGENDAGAEYPLKALSKQVFLDFFGEPAGSERRLRDGGVYTAYAYGPPGRRVQLILLDTRWDRGPLHAVDRPTAAIRRARGLGPYLPSPEPDARLLGQDQWTWLEHQLTEPADLRIIGSSVPVLSTATGWETWANFPQERDRLLELVRGAGGALFLSGDTHWGELHRWTQGGELWELTSSGLTEAWSNASPNENRVGSPINVANFGLVTVDWPTRSVRVALRGVDGAELLQHVVPLSACGAPTAAPEPAGLVVPEAPGSH